MVYSEKFNFELPSRSNSDDMADINVISDNFRIVDNKIPSVQELEKTNDLLKETEEKLKNKITEVEEGLGDEINYDLYCGSGSPTSVVNISEQGVRGFIFDTFVKVGTKITPPSGYTTLNCSIYTKKGNLQPLAWYPPSLDKRIELATNLTGSYIIQNEGYLFVSFKRSDDATKNIDPSAFGKNVITFPKIEVIQEELSGLSQEIINIKEEIKDIKETAGLTFKSNPPRAILGVMTYNIGNWYNGSTTVVPDDKYEKFAQLQKNILDRYSPDILCMQEYNNNFTSDKTAKDVLLDERYLYNENRQPTVIYDGKAICSNLMLSDAENVEYAANDGTERNYHKAYTIINGRKVCIISTHWNTTDYMRAREAQELLDFVKTEDYVIICVDTNVKQDTPETTDYSNTIKKFVDEGYKVCNGGNFGTFMTYKNSNTGTKSALDNIIVSGNINIKSVIMDTQKVGLEEGQDHLPLIAYLEIF